LAGDAAHLVTLTSTLAFAFAVATRFDSTDPSFFDPSWKRNGFCVTNIDVPYWTSHDACLYIDAVAALVLAAVYFALGDTPGLKMANSMMRNGIPGILGHGLGHGMVGREIRNGGTGFGDREEIAMTTYRTLASEGRGVDPNFWMTQLLPGAIFWFTLLKASCPNLKNTTIALMSLVSMSVQLFVPRLLGFTYVQTLLMVAFSINQLMLPSGDKREFSYALYPAMVGFPLTLVGWLESTQCTAFVRDNLYGHAAYDGFIPLGMLGWYLACYVHATATSSTKEKSKVA